MYDQQQYQQGGPNQPHLQQPHQYPPSQNQQWPQQYPMQAPQYQAPTNINNQTADHTNYDIYPPQSNDPFVGHSNGKLSLSGFDERKGFIKKVYSLLSCQLGLTFAMCLIAYYSQGWRDMLCDRYTGNLSVFSWVCFAIMFITEIAIICGKNLARKTPNNYIALFIFTFCFSVVVAGICAVVYNALQEDGGFIVMAAALLTLAVTVSLTIYAFTTKTDFTMMGGALWIIFAVLLVLAIISWFNTSVILELIISSLVIICYGFYLIYDTQLIVGGKQHELSIDDYVLAALLIYVDIIVLFLRILQILLILFKKN